MSTTKKSANMNHFKNLCLLFFGILAPLFVLEITLRSLVGQFPLRYHKYLQTDVRILAQSSKNGLVPRNYVALLGDSYAAGWGDWYFTAIDLDPFGNPPFHSANVIHELTGVDVVSFAQPGTGSFDGIVYNPIKYYEMLRSRGFSLSPPSKFIIYFYEGNDFENNLTFLGRYWNSTEKDYTMKNMYNLFDEIFVRGPLVDGKISDRVIKYIKNLEIMKNLYVAKVIYILGRDLKRLLSQQENVEVPIAEAITSFNVGGKRINFPGVLQAPPMKLDDTEVRKALLIFEAATSYLMKYFDQSDVMVVYIPSPLSSYEIDSEFVNVRGSDGESRLYEKDYVYQRSDELCSYIASIAQKLGAEFLDLRVSIRARARHELVHGAQDWQHFNRVGYEVFGETVAKRLRKGTKDQADRGRSLTALVQSGPASYGFDMPACSATGT